ncbi:hypothetical protein IFO70_32525 [Phormidium tenue FACHB-886]|nr:hypothetical protein [Phormidium tenue FACHB-886]
MPLIPTLPTQPGYRPQAADTSIEADVFYFTSLRQKSLTWRTERFISFNRSTRHLCLSAAKTQSLHTPIRSEYVRRRLGLKWVDCIASLEGEVVVVDPIAFARKVISILEPLNIAYYVGGSVASSLLGENRYTEDLDLIIELDEIKAKPLLAAFLDASFYISDIAVEDAVSGRCSSFNVLDNETLEKADLFVLQNTPFAKSKMTRRIQQLLPDGQWIWISSPEDIVLQKLVWGRDSQSEKQWRDVLGVLKLQGTNLDFEYLRQWGRELNLVEVLDRALREAGLSEAK